jgi:hypothetical protein
VLTCTCPATPPPPRPAPFPPPPPPPVLILVEQALQAGIDRVVLVVAAHTRSEFEMFFSWPVGPELFNALPPAAQAYSDRIREMGQRVTIIVQESQVCSVPGSRNIPRAPVPVAPHAHARVPPCVLAPRARRVSLPRPQEGFGHAVLQAWGAVGEEPFLLMLGDHLYRSSHPTRSCVDQLLSAFDGTASVIACTVVDPSEVGGCRALRTPRARGDWCLRAAKARVVEKGGGMTGVVGELLSMTTSLRNVAHCCGLCDGLSCPVC